MDLRRLGIGPRAGRIDENGNRCRGWHELAQQSHTLCGEFTADVGEARYVAARMVEARNQSDLHGVGPSLEHNWNRCGRRFGRQCGGRATASGDYRDLTVDKV